MHIKHDYEYLYTGPAFTFTVCLYKGDIKVPAHDETSGTDILRAGYLPLDNLDFFGKHSYTNKMIDSG